MNFLILGLNQKKRYNWGHDLFKREIARQHNVSFYGKGYPQWYPFPIGISKIISELKIKPEVILSYMGKYCNNISGLESFPTFKAHIIIDYFPWNNEEEDKFLASAKPDVVFVVCNHEDRLLKKNKYTGKVLLLPFSVDTEIFKNYGWEKKYDISAVYSTLNWAYPSRKRLLKALKQNFNKKRIFLRDSCPGYRVMHLEYINILNQSKIFVNGVDKFKSFNWKFLEACACGAMLLTEPAEDMKSAGFVDGKNCVVFRHDKELINKAKFYLSNDEERIRIANAGHDLVTSLHSNKVRVQQMSEKIKKVL